ncbi:MAG: START domain-containing protein [Pseudomonadales bacterium]|nr:START domain-containing protein [Pseudomonadales bacterium]
MKALLSTLTILLSIVIHSHALATTSEIDRLDWELKNEKDDIKVLTAKVPESPFRAYLAITVIDASIHELVNIIRNPETCSEWVYRCGQSYRYGQEDTNVDLVYTSSEMPFPLQDRDTLARITWEEDPETRVVKAVGVATNNILEPKKKHIRIKNARVIWELTPLASGSTQVRTYGHADPGGDLPSWLINQMSTEVPVKTLNGLKKLVTENRIETKNSLRISSL